MEIYPSWSVINEAEQIKGEVKPVARQLTLLGAVQEAMSANLDLAVMSRAVAAGEQIVRQARSNLLPQLEISSRGALADAALGSPFQSERQFDGTSRLTQLIYSDAARANVSIQANLQRSLKQQLEQTRLNVAQEAALAYINLLRAQTFERVQKENLELTRSNLELARVRHQIEVSGPAETYRWESEMASARNASIKANTPAQPGGDQSQPDSAPAARGGF